MMKTVRLVAPANRGNGDAPYKKGLFPPLGLAAVAAVTPPDRWEVEAVDEAVEPHHFDRPADLVGITGITSVAPRAYEVARQYRRRGVPVVMGGMHASALPEEALRHVDAVVVGEAEGVWHEVLRDAEIGEMKGVYSSSERPCLSQLPFPRLGIFDPDRYLTVNLVQTSRGCPNACSFCAVSRFFGRSYRVRPIKQVLKEIEALGEKMVLFVDDNIAGHRSRAKELFRQMAQLEIQWFGQASLAIARDEEMLDLAADSGCVGLFIGFESLSDANLKQVGKAAVNRVEDFLESIKKIHQRGIGIEGAFIFGLDDDDDTVFRRTIQFARRAGLALAQFGILTPFPGTPLYESLDTAGRIVDTDWSRYTISNAVSMPLKMSRQALEDGFNWAYREFYSYRSVMSRVVASWNRNPLLYLKLNMAFRAVASRMVQAKTSYEQDASADFSPPRA